MPKAVIWVLVGFGFLLLLLGMMASKFIAIIGLVMIIAGLMFGLGPDGVLRKDQVLETWAVLIENGQGKAEEILKNSEKHIIESKAPSLEMEIKSISPSMVQGFIGKERDFLVVKDKDNLRLGSYKIFLNAKDYGNNLDVAWYLTFKPALWQSILSILPYVSFIPKVISDLDLFDQQDLRAYTTNAHSCIQKAVDKVVLDLGQDPSKIDRKSRGFMGIS